LANWSIYFCFLPLADSSKNWKCIVPFFVKKMIPGKATKKLKQLAKHFKAVAIIGPRQSGKTTLSRSCFPEKPCVSLETPANRRFAVEDPHGFLHQYRKGAVLDEVQRTPELLSYLQ